MQKYETKVDIDLLQIFFQSDSNIICAILFGSSQNGIIQPESDLDIGILFQIPPATSVEEFAYYSKLCDIAPFADIIDMVVLNKANEILAFEILKGRYIQKNDPVETAIFYSRICREYEDKIFWIEKQRKYRGYLNEH